MKNISNIHRSLKFKYIRIKYTRLFLKLEYVVGNTMKNVIKKVHKLSVTYDASSNKNVYIFLSTYLTDKIYFNTCSNKHFTMRMIIIVSSIISPVVYCFTSKITASVFKYTFVVYIVKLPLGFCYWCKFQPRNVWIKTCINYYQ